MEERAMTRAVAILNKNPSLVVQTLKALIMTKMYQITIKQIIISLSTNLYFRVINNLKI
jgi:hypothetical protein